MAKIAVIGGGSWGIALTQLLLDNGHQVCVYLIDEKECDLINNQKKTSYYEHIKLPDNIYATLSLEEAISFGDYVLLVVPTKVMRSVLTDISKVLNKDKVFINASKGIEPKTYKRVSEIVHEIIPKEFIDGFVFLTGPSHAEEVIERMVTSVVSASENLDIAKGVQQIFNNNDYFRVYTSNDLIGAEMGASLKNIIALASGIIAGLGYGDNTRAALISRGIIEMIRLSVAVGANEKTLLGLTGIGDLIVTCTSEHSRNFQAGYKIGKGSNLKETLDSMTMVVEGARSAKAAHDMAKDLNVDIPIIEATYNIIYNHVEPRVSIENLMNRDLKSE